MIENLKFYAPIAGVAFLFSFGFWNYEKKKLTGPWEPLGILAIWMVLSSAMVTHKSPGYGFFEAIPKSIDIEYFRWVVARGSTSGKSIGALIITAFAFFLFLFRYCWILKNRIIERRDAKSYIG